jgi:hypothetical protein
MKIYTEIMDKYDYPYGNPVKMLVLYLDKKGLGHEEDITHCAMEIKNDLSNLEDQYDASTVLLDLLQPMLENLVYQTYGMPRNFKMPIESIDETNFKKDCLNGVNGFAMKEKGADGLQPSVSLGMNNGYVKDYKPETNTILHVKMRKDDDQ